MSSSQSGEDSGVDFQEVHFNRNIATIDLTAVLNPETLRRILTYIYTSSCDVFEWDFAEKILSSEKVKYGQRQIAKKENQIPESKGNKKKKKKDKHTKEMNTSAEIVDPEHQMVMTVVKQIKDTAKMLGISSLFHR